MVDVEGMEYAGHISWEFLEIRVWGFTGGRDLLE